MEEKINEENIENNPMFCNDPRKHLQSNQYQDPFFEIRQIRTNYVYFPFWLNFDFSFFIKSVTKQTVYLNNFARKSGFRLQFLLERLLN